MTPRKKQLLSGIVAWMISLMSSMNVYLLSVDGNWAEFKVGVLFTVFLTSALSGLKDLMAYLAESPTSAATKPRSVDVSPAKTTLQTKPTHNAIDLQQLRKEVRRDEGYKNHVYLDTEDNLTGGIGHLIMPEDPEHGAAVNTPIPEFRINEWFSSDVSQAISDARAVVESFDIHPRSVKHALVNMAFNMGRTRLSGFKNTLALINAGRYEEASSEALNSRWADQVGPRARRVSAMIASGSPEINLA